MLKLAEMITTMMACFGSVPDGITAYGLIMKSNTMIGTTTTTIITIMTTITIMIITITGTMEGITTAEIIMENITAGMEAMEVTGAGVIMGVMAAGIINNLNC